MDEFIKKVSKVYGQVYAKVRKLNIKGGVKFPISDLNAEFRWITETTVSPNQKAGDIKEYIEFSANIGEIRVAVSLLAEVMTLDIFESEVATIMAEAYVKTMDNAILSGTGVGQPLGIINDPRVTNEITLTTAEITDWKQWRKKLFAVIPLSKRGQGEFLFTSATVESCLLTMCDANNRPLFKEAPPELQMGNTAGRFYGRETTLVEPDVIKDFDTASSGDVIGIYWVPNDYAINTNLAFGIKQYFDEDTNKYINKGLTIVDGKILDPSGCYIIKKA
jgi:HK97 family phage major capsid protein